MAETVAEWRDRKLAQGKRFAGLYYGLALESWQDHHTKLVLVDMLRAQALVIGALPGSPDGAIDLDDDAIRRWIVMPQVVN